MFLGEYESRSESGREALVERKPAEDVEETEEGEERQSVARRRRAPRRGSHPAVFQRGTRHSAPGTVATRQSHPTDLLSLTSLFDS